VSNEASVFQTLGARVHRSLLRLSPIHLHVHVPNFIVTPFCPEVFAVPNVQAITLHPAARFAYVQADFLLPFLRHPSAQQMRVFDIDGIFSYRCTSAELEQLQTLPHLHSLSLGYTACCELTNLQPLSLLPSLIHLGLHLAMHWEARLLPSLPLCSRLVSLKLSRSVIHTELVNYLAQLPSLQRVVLKGGIISEQTAGAWAALRSLREIQLDDVYGANRLLPVLSSVPVLRVLRWRCSARRSVPPVALPLFVVHGPVAASETGDAAHI
jgi:hypothetical protein